jgi:hypothetical protein
MLSNLRMSMMDMMLRMHHPSMGMSSMMMGGGRPDGMSMMSRPHGMGMMQHGMMMGNGMGMTGGPQSSGGWP